MKTKSIRAAAIAEELIALEAELDEPIVKIEDDARVFNEIVASREEQYREDSQKIRDRWEELGDEAVDAMLQLKTQREAERKAERKHLETLESTRETLALRKRVAMHDRAVAASAEMRTQLNALELIEAAAVCGAGGADRNQGNAETLRRYWLQGKGALKIAWGTSGDFTRCVRHLRKYLGARTEGYCANRHKEANGFWPGDRRNK